MNGETLYHSPTKLAKRWDVDTQTVRRWIREGRLEGVKLASSVRVTDESVAAFEAAAYGPKGGTAGER